MQRVCFQLHVWPDRLEEYSLRHAPVGPDMLRVLAEHGWHNYSLFVRDDGLLIGYFETPSLDAAVAGMATTDVNTAGRTRCRGSSRTSATPRPTKDFYSSTRSSTWRTSSPGSPSKRSDVR
jgi:L-rhamnose mutarotase